MKVVIVESPAKAKTINKYLGADYNVIASVGHIRDLPPKDGSVDPDQDFAMKWQVSPRSNDPIKAIKSAVKGAEKLILATDPDREGEAISWHVHEVLEQAKSIKGMPVERVVFNEITKSAILEAMSKPRQINAELVDAYLARRALDYLVGFSISPVLWRKLPGARSAGRVQSVALKLICEREAEIEAFRADEYWTIEARLKKQDGSSFSARLTHLNGEKLSKLSLGNEDQAMAAVDLVQSSRLQVGKIETKRTRRNPQPPFTTSTLQQEASRKLGFSASRTMRVAQKLYEGINIGKETTGLITYMRTDGVQLGQEAIQDIRGEIVSLKGDRYLPSTPRVYKSKAANAQEAHEAIRPTAINRKPADLVQYLDDDQRKLYDLIWKRTIASQMQSAELDKTSADIVDGDGKVTLRANGSIIVFDGFLSVYREDKDDKAIRAIRARMTKIVFCRRLQGVSHWILSPPCLNSISPNRHLALPMPVWSSAWKNWALAVHQPMPASFQYCRTAIMSSKIAGVSPQKTAAVLFPPFWKVSLTVMSNMALPPGLKKI